MMMQLEHEELDVVPKATFITPKNVLNNNTIIINNDSIKLDLQGDYQTVENTILQIVNEIKKTVVVDYDTDEL